MTMETIAMIALVASTAKVTATSLDESVGGLKRRERSTTDENPKNRKRGRRAIEKNDDETTTTIVVKAQDLENATKRHPKKKRNVVVETSTKLKLRHRLVTTFLLRRCITC